MSTMQVNTDNLMFRTLETHLFQKVWNMPLTERRRNIILRAESRGLAKVNTVNLGCMYTSLPYASSTTKKSFYVYSAAKCCMGGIVVDTEQDSVKSELVYNDGWVRLKDYLNIRPFDLRIHGTFGEWLYRDDIYIKNHPYEDMFLIAVEKEMARQILGPDYDFYTLYMSVYFDSDNDMSDLSSSSPMIQCFHPSASTGGTNAAFQAYSSLSEYEKMQTMCFIDGREATPTILEDTKFGQYIEIVRDPDIICNIVMNLTNPEENNIYRSYTDNTFKYIVHIPKQIVDKSGTTQDISFQMITHNTCDIFIRPLNTVEVPNARLKGLFVHRFNTSEYEYGYTKDEKFKAGKTYYTLKNGWFTEATDVIVDTNVPANTYYERGNELFDRKITQITHHDFGVSEKLLQPYAQHINSSEYAIRVVVRKHRKDNKLEYDCNFLKNLYAFDDATILKMLTGDGPSTLSFWKAEELEQSEFIKMLFEVPTSISLANARRYINALGYYNSLSLITPKVNRVIISPNNTNTFRVNIPVSMLTCDGIRTIVCVNGIKVPENMISTERVYQHLNITISDDISLNTYDRVVVELFDAPIFKADYFTPRKTDNNEHIDTVAYIDEDTDYTVFHVVDNIDVSGDYFTDNYIIDPSSQRGYKKVNKDEVIVLEEKSVVMDGVKRTRLTFASTVYGNTYLICSSRGYATYSNESLERSGNVNIGTETEPSDILYSGKLSIIAKSWNSDDTVEIPFIDPSWNTICYLNGRELIRGIDYTLCNINDAAGYSAFRNIFFNNISYLTHVYALTADEKFMAGKVYYIKVGEDYRPATVVIGGDVQDNTYYNYVAANDFEVVVTSDQSFMEYDGFTLRYTKEIGGTPSVVSKIEEINPYVFWFNRLCMACSDGNTLSGINSMNGSLWITENARQGSLYGVRGYIPAEAKEFVDRFSTNESDVTKLTAIAEYIRSMSRDEEPTLEVIEHSHHIASITMAAIVKDVITGRKRLNYDTDHYNMLGQLEEYITLRKYDAAMTGIATDLTIYNAGSTIVNNTYKLFDKESKGLNRTWRNDNVRLRVWWNCNTKRWEISSTVATKPNYTYYYADDEEGKFNPWDLHWQVAEYGEGNVPKFLEGMLDLRYIDLFPSYSSSLHVVMDDMTLRQAIKAVFPFDSVRDGDTVR